MEEIKLWKVSGSEDDPTITGVPTTVQTKTEEMLEEILVKAPNLLFEGLKLVGRQIDTLASGTLDLLGVDEDGQLVVFELKRGTLTREAVAQILDYASYLAELSPLALSEYVSNASGKYGIEKIDFSDWYENQFAGKDLETIGKPRMVLVGLGTDERAKRIVEFLADRNIAISLMTFHCFNDGEGMYLAKQVEVLQKPITQSTRTSKQSNLQALERRIQQAGVRDLFNTVAGTLRAELTNSYEWPNQNGFAYFFQDVTEMGTPSNRVYVALSIPSNPKGSVLLMLYERGIQAAGADWFEVAKSWGERIVKRKGYSEIRISSQQDWKAAEPEVRRLCDSILHGRKAAQEKRVTAERHELERVINDTKNGPS